MNESQNTARGVFNGNSNELSEVISILKNAEKKLHALRSKEKITFSKLEHEEDIECAVYVCNMLKYAFEELEETIADLDRLRVINDKTGKVFI